MTQKLDSSEQNQDTYKMPAFTSYANLQTNIADYLARQDLDD